MWSINLGSRHAASDRDCTRHFVLEEDGSAPAVAHLYESGAVVHV
jgi:hypothetical protein